MPQPLIWDLAFYSPLSSVHELKLKIIKRVLYSTYIQCQKLWLKLGKMTPYNEIVEQIFWQIEKSAFTKANRVTMVPNPL